ncbi:MAG TPA: 30S ribosomal protein S20 [Gemmataceae bacterium]|jgi:small subunit ribosomal protein S20|nr:30S ribosomal protein S20 [Gemmataceae bacterium]
MPHTRSANKQHRKNQRRRLHNRSIVKAIRTQVKKVEAAADGDAVDQLRKEFVVAVKKLDKAAAKRVIHPNMAARKKSQLARLLHNKETAGKTAPP